MCIIIYVVLIVQVIIYLGSILEPKFKVQFLKLRRLLHWSSENYLNLKSKKTGRLLYSREFCSYVEPGFFLCFFIRFSKKRTDTVKFLMQSHENFYIIFQYKTVFL